MPNTQNFFVHTVLVRPTYPKNIGQAARATANCGFGKLHIIDPQCELGSEMRKGAAGSQKTLDDSLIYKSWEEFNSLNPQTFRIALSRRLGKQRKLFSLEEGSLNFITNAPSNVKDLYLIFGPEADGLSNDDLEHTHTCCNLSLYGDFKSLNLAHAVLLSQHTVHSVLLKQLLLDKTTVPKKNVNTEDTFANNQLFPDKLLSDWLVKIKMQQNPERTNAFDTLRRMILRAFPSQNEILMLEKALRKALNDK